MVSGTRGNAIDARTAALIKINEWRAVAGLPAMTRDEIWAMDLGQRLDAMRDARMAADAARVKQERDGLFGQVPESGRE